VYSIGTTQTSDVVIDLSNSKGYESQPRWQEWLAVIECISAAGNKILAYVIFKGQNLMTG